jgi:hypothetical protein
MSSTSKSASRIADGGAVEESTAVQTVIRRTFARSSQSEFPAPKPDFSATYGGGAFQSVTRVFSNAAPVGVRSSPSTGPGRTGRPSIRNTVAGAGAGTVPWAHRTSPKPVVAVVA